MRFEEITENKERIREGLINNYEEWGAPLSLEDYLERERLLDEIHRENGLAHRTFAIIDDNDRVIAACEALSRPLYHGGGSHSSDHCFASVFVKKEYRGKGLAEDMMSQAMKNYSDPEDQISLWSDVGDYYTRVGFDFPPNFEGEPRWAKTIICSSTGPSAECEKLDLAKTNSQLLPEHMSMLTRHADALYYDCNGDIKIVVVTPHRGLYQQLQFRALYTAQKLNLPEPTNFGARTLDGHGWCTWTYMFGGRKLVILGISGSSNEIGVLLSAAAEEAAKYDLSVELYETSLTEQFEQSEIAALEAIGVKAEIINRKTSLPMSAGRSAWFCPGAYCWY